MFSVGAVREPPLHRKIILRTGITENPPLLIRVNIRLKVIEEFF